MYENCHRHVAILSTILAPDFQLRGMLLFQKQSSASMLAKRAALDENGERVLC
jgi:hypothetical protein